MHNEPQPHPPQLALTGPIAWMARHSVAPNLLMFFMLIGGLIVSLRIKQEVFPEFELDMVTITVPYPGSSPEEVEQGIVLAVEESIRGIIGVKEVTAVAREGAGVVTAELEEGSDAQRIYQDIQQEVERITTLPEEAEEPEVVLQIQRRDVMDVILYGEADEWVLRELGEQVRDRFLQDPNITQVDLEPLRTFEVSVEVSQDKLRAYGLTLQEIADRIRAASIELPGGSVRTESGEILLRMKERRDWAREFGNIPVVSSAAGTRLLIRDIATVKDTFEEKYEFLSYNGKPAVNLEIYRVGDQTPIGVSDAVHAKLAEISPGLPPGIGIDVRRDQSQIYRQRLDLMLTDGFAGLVLVLVILAVFLEYKLAFWVTMGIPIAFLGAFLFLPWLDVTINMMSMFAFIIALGIVVDDAIVVGENVFECRQAGMDRVSAAITGTRQVAMPVVFSALVNMSAFIPLAFPPGTLGKIWAVIPIVVCATFAISLVETLFILPAHLAHMKLESATPVGRVAHRAQQRLSNAVTAAIEKYFGWVLGTALRIRYHMACVTVSILLVVVAYVGSGRLGFEMMPRVESDQADTTAVLPYGSALSKMVEVRDRLVTSAQAVAAAHGGETLMRGVRGYIEENEVRVTAYLLEPDVRPISTTEFAALWREQTGPIDGLHSLKFQSDRRGPGSGSSLTVELAHRDIETLDHAGEALAASLAEFTNVHDVDDGYSPGKQQLDFEMLPEGLSLGLTGADLARQLRGAFYGAEALRQQRGRNEIKVMVRLPKAERMSGYDVESFIARTPAGAQVPLHQVARVKPGRAYTVINRRDGRRTVSVTADVVPEGETEQVMAMLQETTLPELERAHPGLSYSFQGKQEDMREIMSSLRKSFVVVLMLIYVLLGIPFRSYIQPLVVMVSIPFGIVGAVIGHMLMGYSLSIISVMGIIALMGVVINESLVLIEYANRLRSEGASSGEAIRLAGIRRFRPIMLTTVTTFFGLAPMIFETSRQARFMIPMAISLGFGSLFATLITLMIIPCLYLIHDDMRGIFAPADRPQDWAQTPEPVRT